MSEQITKSAWTDVIGESWYNSLRSLWDSKGMGKLMIWLDQIYDNSLVYPAREDVFKAFRATPYDKVRLVFLGMDPYPNSWQGIPYANGLCFDCSNVTSQGGSLSPSFDKIMGEYNRAYPSHFTVDVMDGVLQRWAREGVLLLNASLTVKAGQSGFHKAVWKPFTKGLLSRIGQGGADLFSGGEIRPTPYLIAFGVDAWNIVNEAGYPSAKVIRVKHPAASCYANEEWKPFGDSNFFDEINKRSGFNYDW